MAVMYSSQRTVTDNVSIGMTIRSIIYEKCFYFCVFFLTWLTHISKIKILISNKYYLYLYGLSPAAFSIVNVKEQNWPHLTFYIY